MPIRSVLRSPLRSVLRPTIGEGVGADPVLLDFLLRAYFAGVI